MWRRGACALLLCALVCAKDDDFAFDNSEEFQAEISNSSEATSGLKRLWGIPDTSAYVGHLFRMEIPSEAFSGDVVAYKVRSADGRRAPAWLAVDSRHGLMSGVPLAQDVGTHTLLVTAHAHSSVATDTFIIEVKKASDKPHSRYGACGASESKLSLLLLLDTRLHQLKPKQRTRALMHLATFMALDGDEFSIESFKSSSGAHSKQTVLQSGPGSSQRRRGDATTSAISFNVGCGAKLWARHKVLVAGIREQARDGTLAHILELPVLGWRLMAEKPKPMLVRPRRQLEDGSGAYYDEDDADYSGYDDEEEDDYDFGSPSLVPVSPGTPASPPHPHRHHHGLPDLTSPDVSFVKPPTSSEPAYTTPERAPTTTIQMETESDPLPPPTTVLTTTSTTTSTSTTTTTTTTTTPVPTTETIPTSVTSTTVTELFEPFEAFPTSTPAPAAEDIFAPATLPTLTLATAQETNKRVQIVASEAGAASTHDHINATLPTMNRNMAMDLSPIIIVPDNSITTTESTPTVLIQASSETAPSLPSPTETPTTTPAPSAPITVTTPSTTSSTTTVTTPETTVEVTRQETLPTTEKSSTIIGRTTETIDFHMPVSPSPPNQPPQLSYHMKKLAVTAGKAFRYLIPYDLFLDNEEGTNLTYTMYETDSAPLKPSSWVQFLPDKKEVYGLPLEEHVSRWSYTVQASDSAGAAARAPLDIIVQHHKGQRTLNHQFYLTLKVQYKYQYAIDWQIHVLEGLVNLFRTTDMEHIIVRNVSSHDDLVTFVWSDDTLAKDVCPMQDIQRLMAILESDSEKGFPSANLSRVMLPQLKVASVGWTGLGACATTPAPPPVPPHLDSYPPVPRNQVDLVQATAGHLLVFKVPQDTFYDPEDGDTRHLKLSVIRGDRTPLPSAHWMQFDQANQEFYGLPTDRDVGKKEYQLIAEDSTGKTANDVLLVEVNAAPPIQPPVEFQMTMNFPYAQLAGSALAKRTFLENLAKLFGDKEASSIRVKSITDKPTTVVWFNTSLPMDRCPNDRIEELKRIIIKEEQQGSPESLTDQVDLIFDKHDVMSIRLIPRGLCAQQNPIHTKTTSSVHHIVPSTERESKSVNMQEYIVTFIIPAIVVVCMILIAGVIACVLYRRRKTGKMSVGDEEERQAFRSKGIPVIFQDELEEKPDPSNKSPIIMKEEKPPLLPPPDYKPDAESPTPSHHTPYRPPPPFTASRDPRPTSRPKATPTYRKPPPYVPP